LRTSPGKVKVRANVPLYHAIKTYGVMEVYLHAFFILGIRWGVGKLYTQAALTPGKEPPVPIG
jgi:hypothetical protein